MHKNCKTPESLRIGCICSIRFIILFVADTLVPSINSPHSPPSDAFGPQNTDVTSHDVTKHPQLPCLFSNLLQPMAKKTSKFHIGGSLLSVDSPHKGPTMWQAFPCHDVIMAMVILTSFSPGGYPTVFLVPSPAVPDTYILVINYGSYALNNAH